MDDLLIVGAGGFGREVFYYAMEAGVAGWNYRIRGFLDDDRDAMRGFGTGVGVVGTMLSSVWLSQQVVIALGDPVQRRIVRKCVNEAGGRLVTLVHPRAYVAPEVSLGDGVIVGPGAFVGTGASIEANVAINAMASVGHDVAIGLDSVVSPHAAISGWAELGECVLLGTHATVTPGVRVGGWSKLAAGSVVTKNAAIGSLLVGNPARGRVIFSAEGELKARQHPTQWSSQAYSKDLED